ncbi:MAG: tripartite tricarboxylate transporter TctB family protein [Thermodesulfobacteriota bacterium]
MQHREDIASSVVVVLFGAAFLIYASRYPVDSPASPGPGVFPRIAGGFVVLLGSWQLVHALWKWKRRAKPASLPEGGGPGAAGGRASLLLIAAFVLYILGIRYLGFFVSTFLFAVCVSRLSGKAGLWKPVLLSAGLCLFCYLVFVGWLKISFPSGLLF